MSRLGTPLCYWSRRTILPCDLARSIATRAAGFFLTNAGATFPDADVWRMDWFARLCNVHIDDIHAFQVAPGQWFYCFRAQVRPYANYTLGYL